jgi:hypothetical protein
LLEINKYTKMTTFYNSVAAPSISIATSLNLHNISMTH